MRFAAALTCFVMVAVSCTDGEAGTGAAGTGPVSPTPISTEATVLAVADLTDCRGPDAEVAALVRSLDGTILMPGDLAYDVGSVEDLPHVECRLVMWHEPRFTSSANYRGIPRMGDFYGRVHGSGADVLVVGHSHHYERLGPLAPNGDPSPDGMMNFTVGMGGAEFTAFGEPRAGSMVRTNEHRGVLRLTLREDGYDWEFVNVESNETPLVDAGSASC